MKTWLVIYCYLSCKSTLYALFHAGSLSYIVKTTLSKCSRPCDITYEVLCRPHDITSLQDLRDFYNRTVERCSEEQDRHADVIVSDHLNIEHVVAFNLAHVPDGR